MNEMVIIIWLDTQCNWREFRVNTRIQKNTFTFVRGILYVYNLKVKE